MRICIGGLWSHDKIWDYVLVDCDHMIRYENFIGRLWSHVKIWELHW